MDSYMEMSAIIKSEKMAEKLNAFLEMTDQDQRAKIGRVMDSTLTDSFNGMDGIPGPLKHKTINETEIRLFGTDVKSILMCPRMMHGSCTCCQADHRIHALMSASTDGDLEKRTEHAKEVLKTANIMLRNDKSTRNFTQDLDWVDTIVTDQDIQENAILPLIDYTRDSVLVTICVYEVTQTGRTTWKFHVVCLRCLNALDDNKMFKVRIRNAKWANEILEKRSRVSKTLRAAAKKARAVLNNPKIQSPKVNKPTDGSTNPKRVSELCEALLKAGLKNLVWSSRDGKKLELKRGVQYKTAAESLRMHEAMSTAEPSVKVPEHSHHDYSKFDQTIADTSGACDCPPGPTSFGDEDHPEDCILAQAQNVEEDVTEDELSSTTTRRLELASKVGDEFYARKLESLIKGVEAAKVKDLRAIYSKLRGLGMPALRGNSNRETLTAYVIQYSGKMEILDEVLSMGVLS
jgi:hypothetical protein